AEGALSAAFVPTFMHELTTRGREPAWRLANNVLGALLLVTALVVAAGLVFAHPLVAALAGDYAAVPGKLELTVFLARIMLPMLIFIAVAATCMGMLNSLGHFFVPALAPATFNVVTIVSAFTLVPLMPRFGVAPITGIAIGALAGGVAQVAVQWPLLRRERFVYRPTLTWSDPALHRVLALMGPGTIGLAATQVNVFVNVILATRQGTGAVSWLTFAFRLMYLPIGLFGVSIATAVLPAVSRAAARRDDDGVRRTVADGMALTLMLNVPATVGLMVLASPIVRLIFERRAFTPADTTATAAALQCYAIGLVGYAIVRIASPTFYALRQSRTPIAISVGAMLTNVVLNLVLVHWLGYRGLALGTALAALSNAAALLYALRRRLNGLEGRRLLGSCARIALASALMGVAAFATDRVLERLWPGSHVIAQAVRLGSTIGISLGVLAAAAAALRIREFHESVALVIRRVRQS
ncbi:MAG TPA: murein biosynthesis integral membrane protein MurJ, partial [Vicinamibacterales bacterium]|nr:murein biosynthesis integral membrane protein MurJ [Vicinamibacterales bacterium]